MEILNAYDLTGSYRAAAELCGCSHHTVKKAVEDRDAGLAPVTRRARMIDDWRDVLEGWVGESKGKIRGDKAHDKLVALGYTGTDRTTRRALAEIKSQWRLGNTRVHRPWITEPGLWLQYDFADGPLVAGRKVVLLVAWLAWSRYRVVIALRDRTAPSVFAGLDRIFRLVGGAPPTYLLTDNEKTVTVGHIAGVPVRNRSAVTFGRYYGISVLTCEPADPASKGGGGERRQARQGRHRAHRDEPAAPPVRQLRRRRNGVRAVRHRHQCPGAPHDGSAPGRDAHRRTPGTARNPGPASHRRVGGGDPAGSRQHSDGHLRTLPILPTGNTIGSDGVDSPPRGGTDEVVICALDDGGARSRWRGTAAPPPPEARPSTTLISLTTTTKFPGDYRVRPAPSPSRRSWPWHWRSCMAQRSRRCRNRTHPAEDGPRRRTLRAGRPC